MKAIDIIIPEGDQPWKIRSRYGPQAIFETPEMMIQAACEYFAWVDAHPDKKQDFIRSGPSAGEIVYLDARRPYTVEELAMYCGVNSKYFAQFKTIGVYKSNPAIWDVALDFITDSIRSNKYVGGMVGAFNAMLVSRDLGLMDRTQIASDPDNPMPTGAQTHIYLPAKGSTENQNEDV